MEEENTGVRPIFRMATRSRLKLDFTVYAGLTMFNHLTVQDFGEKMRIGIRCSEEGSSRLE